MIDIHAHILPGLDDGADNIEEALIMAETAARSGVNTIVATPHSNQHGYFENYESEKIRNLFSELQREIAAEKIPVSIKRGMEVFASADIIQKISEKWLISLNGSRYFLVEFNFNETPDTINEVLKRLLSNGYVPIVAHPERYYCVQDHPNLVYEWCSLGALSQLNKDSVFGFFGRRAAQTSELLLHHNLIYCIASDAHNVYTRTASMEKIEDYIIQKFSFDYKDALLLTHPRCIIEDRLPLNEYTPIPIESKKRLFF